MSFWASGFRRNVRIEWDFAMGVGMDVAVVAMTVVAMTVVAIMVVVTCDCFGKND